MFLNFLRCLAIIAAGAWLGSLILIGAIVAPTTFRELEKAGVENHNAVAGQVMAVNFVRHDKMQFVCAVVIAVWQVANVIAGRRGVRDWLRLGLLAVAAGCFLHVAWVLTPKILDLQPILADPQADILIKARFQEFHQTAVIVSQINVFVLMLLGIEMAWPQQRKAVVDIANGKLVAP